MSQNSTNKDVKKTSRASLENNIALYFLMGIVVALAVIFVAFEWGNREINMGDIDQTMVVEEIEDIQITPPEEDTPPPPPPPEQPVNVETLQIVEDDVKVADVEIASVDDAVDKLQQTFTPPAPAQRGRGEEKAEDNAIFDFLEEMPEFPGGTAAMLKWLSDNVEYPPLAAENNIQGRVMVSFVVERDGSISNVSVVRSVDPSLDKEALRLIKAMPKWKPGMQTGKAVRCRFNIPVVFRLR